MEQQFHPSGELGAMNENLFIEANQNCEHKSLAARCNRFQLVTYLETSNFIKAGEWENCNTLVSKGDLSFSFEEDQSNNNINSNNGNNNK